MERLNIRNQRIHESSSEEFENKAEDISQNTAATIEAESFQNDTAENVRATLKGKI